MKAHGLRRNHDCVHMNSDTAYHADASSVVESSDQTGAVEHADSGKAATAFCTACEVRCFTV